MTQLWIRVDADEASSIRVGALAASLGVRPVHVLGYTTSLAGKVAMHAPDGDISGVPDLMLEDWARWDGEPGVFAKAYRKAFARDGRVTEWDTTLGKGIQDRKTDAQRKRDERARRKAEREAQSAVAAPGDSPASVDGPRTVRGESDSTGRDVTGRDVRDGRDERLDGDGDLPAIPRAHDAGGPGAVAVPSAAQPPGTATATATPDLPPATRTLIAQAYTRATPSRIADVQAQAIATLSTRGAKLDRGVFVHAVDAAHLEAASRTVLRQLQGNLLRDPDKAIRVLLQVLRETWPEANAAHEKAQLLAGERSRGRSSATPLAALIPDQIRRQA